MNHDLLIAGLATQYAKAKGLKIQDPRGSPLNKGENLTAVQYAPPPFLVPCHH